MAHFAQLDKNNKVIQVIVIDNNVTHNADGVEQETLGIAFCKSLFGEDTKWVQTSYSSSIRKIFAGLNYTYEKDKDRFIPPCLHTGWIFDEELYCFVAPIPEPDYDKETHSLDWNDKTESWIIVPRGEPTND